MQTNWHTESRRRVSLDERQRNACVNQLERMRMARERFSRAVSSGEARYGGSGWGRQEPGDAGAYLVIVIVVGCIAGAAHWLGWI